jgi:membrane-associated phospholipid phosphatase
MQTTRAAQQPHSGPLDPSPGSRDATVETTLAERWRRLREGVPSAIFLVAGAVVLLVLLVAIGYLITKVFSHDWVGREDAGISRWFAAHRSSDLNQVTHETTLAAETITITLLAVVTVVVSALAWRRWREPMLVALAVAGEVTIFLLVTLLVDRQRPPVRHLDQAPPTSSFPSGHVAAAVCMYGALAVLANERARSALVRGLFVALAVLIPLAVALSRLYRGMHYLSDVLGGVILGVTWLFLVVKAIRLGVVHYQLRHRSAGPLPGRRRAHP